MPVSRVRVIWFDQDDTLYDYGHAMRRAIAAAVSVIHECFPHTRRTLTADAAIQVRADVADRCRRAGMNFVEARHEAFRETLMRYARLDEELADEVTATYYRALHAEARPFEDTVTCLEQLSARYTLGVLSNGLSLLSDLGISDFFEHRIYAEDAGLCKPDLKMFRLAESIAGVTPAQCLLVGDDEVADVVGARVAGWHVVWLNRDGRPWRRDECPPPQITARSLAEVPSLVQELDA